MNDQMTPHTQAGQTRGLATLALLMAYYDERHDHVEMFSPFVIDAIREFRSDDFLTADIKEFLLLYHHLDIPVHTLDILLTRLWKRGKIKRTGGRYFRIANALPLTNLTEARLQAEKDQNELAFSFCSFAEKSDVRLTIEDGLCLIIAFLENFHVSLLLGEEQPKDALAKAGDRKSHLLLVAQYIRNLYLSNNELLPILQHILEGFVLQNTLLLRDIKVDRKSFSELEIFFDTGFLFSALGLTGNFAKMAARETLDLLRVTMLILAPFNVPSPKCAVFWRYTSTI